MCSIFSLRTSLTGNVGFSVTRNFMNRNNSLQSELQVRHASKIKVIILQESSQLGVKGQIIEVKRGYARNFLIPQKIVDYATPLNRVKHSDIMPEDIRTNALRGYNVPLLEFAQKKILTIKRPVRGGKFLTSALTLDDLRNALKAEGVEAKQIIVYKIIQILGTHHIIVDGEKILLKIERSE